MQISKITPTFNSSINKNKQSDVKTNYSNISFGSAAAEGSKFFEPLKKLFSPIFKLYNNFTDKIALGFGKLMDKDFFKDIVEKTSKSEHFKKYLVPDLMTTGSVILSSFYVSQTLTNKKLDEERRKTLAINQTGVWAVSTVLNYTLNGLVEPKVNKFIDKFKNYNKTESSIIMNKYLEGIKNAKSIMIFDFIYRYLAPVAVTPLANHIGNMLQEKKEMQLQEGNKQ